MSIPGSGSPLLLASTAAAAAADPVVATKSLRFNNDDSAHLTRTPSSGGNQKTWTWSGWVKRSSVSGSGTYPDLFGAFFGNSGRYLSIRFDPSDRLFFYGGAGSPATNILNLTTTQVFRDFSAWYHIVVAFDTTQGTASERAKLYVNGAQITDFDTETYPAQNVNYFINQASVEHVIGSFFGTGDYLDGYLADVYFIDGSALAPTSFGAFDSNGVWQASTFSGTYGSNGFHLAFGDSTSSAALGTDSSGNSNTFTVNNISGNAVGLSTANQGFGVVTYTGDGGSQSITGVGFQPDFVWIKNRETFTNQVHALFDVVRGREMLGSHSSNDEADWHGSNSLPYRGYVDSFDSDGFSLAANSASNLADYVNYNNTDYVAWCWKAGGSASSNTDGTITSSVSANTTYGFSVVGYTGNNTSGATVGHGLSSTPKWIIVKSREQSGQFWHVYHASLDADEYAYLNNSNAVTSGNDFMNGTRPTSSVFTLGNGNGCNKSGDNVIAYCWAEVSGFSKISSYNGSGGAATKVVTGFRPRYIIARPINDSNGNRWHIVDTERGVGGSAERLFAEDGSVHTARQEVLIENDGFIVTNTTTDSGSLNRNTEYIYAAFASKPTGEEIDSLFDVPTNGDQSDTGAGGEVAGNYATLNPLQSGLVLKNGNLTFSMGTRVDWKVAHGTIQISSGKFYWEITNGTQNSSGANIAYGIRPISVTNGNTQELGYNDGGGKAYFSNGGTRNGDTSGTASYGASFGTGDVIGVAFDADNGTLVFYKNGASQGTAFTGLTGSWVPAFGLYTGQTQVGTDDFHVNFGQREFTHSAPTNYKALCTTNLPTPTVADGSDYFDQLTYVGNQTSRSITGLSFSPDLVIVKNRERSAYQHYWVDNVRGGGKNLYSASTEAEHVADRITTLDSAGFTLSNHMGPNYSGENYIAHCWDAGSSTSSNTDGSITTNVRANTAAGFSICSYTGIGDGSTESFGHGLNTAPELVIIKNRDSATNWAVYHKGAGAGGTLQLNSTVAKESTSMFNSQHPSNSVVYLKENSNRVNNPYDYIAYCFAPVAGFSAAPSWTGNGSSDGVFIHLGFRPKAFWFKRTDGSANWYVYDSTRSTINPVNKNLEWNTADAENTLTSMNVDFLSNGIKVRGSDGDINASSGDYVGFAWAENPFQANGGLAR